MKKGALLNSKINSVIGKLGHTDQITIGDAGLPISSLVKRIDLALKRGTPSLLETLETILDEMSVEEAIIASEMKNRSSDFYEKLLKTLKNKCDNITIIEIPHEEFKVMTKESKAVIRTGECTPYANIILKSGVVF